MKKKKNSFSKLTQVGTFVLTLALTTAVNAQDVYVAGFDNDGNSSTVAQIWEEDGTTHDLTSGTYTAHAKGVFADDGDIYAAGFEYNSSTISIAKIWKNGISESLTNGNENAKANDIFVYDGDVYAVGYESNGSKNLAKVWKNGNAQNLTDGSENAKAKSIFVYNGDVYVVGITYDYSVDGNNVDSVIKIWKNGTEQDLTNGVYNVDVESIFVDNGDVYVTGREFNGNSYIAKIWKNGNAQNLTDGTFSNASANSVFVHPNGDVLVTGHDGPLPRLWHNGVEETLNYNGNLDGGRGHSIYVSGSNVYVAGYLRESNNDNSEFCNYAALWKNQEVVLTSSAPGCTENTGMFAVTVDDGQLGVEDFADPQNDITLFPNPVEDILQIETKAGNIQAIELFSITGKRLQTWEGQSEIDLSSFSEGNYFVRISTADNQTVNKQIIKK